MQWPNLVGKLRGQPPKGNWHEWKQVIADHCEGQCIYCAISEARFGGVRNFHIEHFRPKARFPELENDIRNLYLACGVCNVLKCDDWPCEPIADHSLAAYPDPALVNYNMLFEVSPATYKLESSIVAGNYLIERILLNRAQLILERRLAAMHQILSEFEDWAENLLDDLTPAEMKAMAAILLLFTRIKTSAFKARPYRDVDTKRRVKTKGVKKRLR